jgi:CDP-diacylglycerol--glycerol-3-phosphate 3-phosphatidyltransferase
MLDGEFRTAVDARTAPIGRAMVKLGFSADVLTGSGLVFAVATAFAIGLGHNLLAVVLLTLTGLHDLLDGPVAKASARASIRGSFFDSVTDRVSDGVLLGGVAYYLEMQHRGSLILLPFAILTSTFMISYQRSKAESLGIAAKGGLMERAERMILLGVALLHHSLLIPVLWVLLVLTTLTALGRFRRVWTAASALTQG